MLKHLSVPDSHFLQTVLVSYWGYILSVLWGSLWGSFAGVCIHRIPVSKSIVTPGSSCPSCNRPIAAYDNIPVISFLWLKGRCRHCRTQISWHYPATELLVMLLSAGLFYRFVVCGDKVLLWNLISYLVAFFFALTLIILSIIDGKYKILPNVITYPAIVIFFALGRITLWASFWDSSLSMIGIYLLVRLFSDGYYYFTKREGIGHGDGKLLAIVGGLLGWKCLFMTILLGSISGILITIPILLLQRRRQAGPTESLRTVAIPFGPFLSFGAIVSVFLFAGRDVADIIFGLALPWFVQGT